MSCARSGWWVPALATAPDPDEPVNVVVAVVVGVVVTVEV